MPDFNVTNVDDDAVLKEVWNTENIEAKTQLSEQQIERVNKVLTLADITGSELLRTHANNFMILQKSLNRQSMNEFVAVVKNKHEDEFKSGGFMNRMMG